MSDYINTWPDASSQALDGNPDTGIGQISPNFQVSSGLPVGVYPRVVGTGNFGVSASRLPTTDSFTLYVVGTFDDGNVVKGISGPGGFALSVTGGGKVVAAVWPNAFDFNSIISVSAVATPDAARILRLTFNRPLGTFRFHVQGALVPAVVLASGLPTASGLSENSCNPQSLDGTFKARIGYCGGSDVSGTYYNRVLMYDAPHSDASAALVEARLRTQWGL
jgi:hypothetical protein